MKKRLLAMLLVGLVAGSLMACGDKDEKNEVEGENVEETVDYTYDVNDYVTLGDYKGIEITLEGEYEVTEETLASYIESKVATTCPYVNDDSQTEIKEDSIIDIDYVGSQDGVAFKGGSAENVIFDMASNGEVGGASYIPGFSDGLVGHTVGEEVACDVTFPENYGNADLAGQAVVFTFQINGICKQADPSELTDEMVAEFFSCETVSEFEEQMKSELAEECESNKKSDVRTNVINTVVNSATVKGVPEGILEGRVNLYMDSMKSYCEASGYEINDFIINMYGTDYDTYVATISDQLKETMEQELVFEAIAKAEGIAIDEKYDTYVEKVLKNSGIESAEDLYARYEIPGFSGKQFIELQFLAEEAVQLCIDNAVVND